ncbi:MAG: SPFH domain-containing protein [Dehalococcoidia bacterium]|jgi:regulator of protease activity HflC (stomatin/prohibitin superfamily)|nr:SPFH domain-containing protein [Dehalococcoidia bacterium]|tara:strand:- start:317 stop:1258 length:942 start_codon:yes stop_codon:yes gene_type:complete
MEALILLPLIVLLLFNTIFTVQQQTFKVVERFGKYKRIARPGINVKIPFVDKASRAESMRIRQLDVPVETKTEDNVFVKVSISVQFVILEGKEFEAFYRLDNAEQQITSYVFDVVRARVPLLSLDNLFEKKDEIAVAVKSELDDIMIQFGYGIVKALVTDIDPDAKVKAAMNEINEAQRLRVAATEKGEAEKIIIVKQAEAEAESDALRGLGIANERKAIIDGLKESIDDFQKSISGTGPMEVMNLVLLTQYFDSLKSIASAPNTSSIFIPHSPSSMSDFSDQMRNAIMQAGQITDNTDNNDIKINNDLMEEQ